MRHIYQEIVGNTIMPCRKDTERIIVKTYIRHNKRYITYARREKAINEVIGGNILAGNIDATLCTFDDRTDVQLIIRHKDKSAVVEQNGCYEAFQWCNERGINLKSFIQVGAAK